MIQLSPHTEPAAFAANETSNVSPHNKTPQQSKNEKNTLGVFAKILAGLSGKRPSTQAPAMQGLQDHPEAKTGTGELFAGAEVSKTAKSNKTGPALPGAEKDSRKTGALPVTAKKAGAAEGQTEISDQEKNILFAVGRLANQNAEQNNQARQGVSPLTAGDTGQLRKAVKAEAAPQALTGTAAERGQIIPPAAAETAETARDKRVKGRAGSAEVTAQSDSAGKKTGGEELSLRPDQRLEAAKKAVSGEREGRNRVEEARSKRKSAAFEVRDYRTGAAPADLTPREAASALKVNAESAKEITLELRLPNQGQESSAATTSWEAKAGQSFEDMLARELHQNFNNDIVRHASVALRDGGEGTIRLALKPESLGNVKIRLEMTDNKITGYIVVESEEALRAFEREISSLEKAFRDSGFDDANLEMSLAGDNRGTEQQWQETEASQLLPEQFAASRYDTAIEQMEIPAIFDVYGQGSRAVNVLV